jgi:hypothetical protein
LCEKRSIAPGNGQRACEQRARAEGMCVLAWVRVFYARVQGC